MMSSLTAHEAQEIYGKDFLDTSYRRWTVTEIQQDGNGDPIITLESGTLAVNVTYAAFLRGFKRYE